MNIEKMKISGMTCASCSSAVEKALNRMEGVELAHVNLATETATIKFDPELVNREILEKAVRNTGYDIAQDETANSEVQEYNKDREKMIFAWLFTIPIEYSWTEDTDGDGRIDSIRVHVNTGVILSDTFLITQANSLDVMNTINAESEYFISLMGQAGFDDMMANFTSLDDAMGGAIGNMVIPDNSEMSSALYAVDADGVISQISEADLTDAMNNSVDIEQFLNGSELLVGYTIPSSASMTLSELMESTTIIDENVAMEELPMFTLDGMDASALDMSEMMSSMMSLMMGQNMGIPMDELVSEPFMSMMESFANGMGLEVDTFMMMMNQMMDTMIISDMMDSMVVMAHTMK